MRIRDWSSDVCSSDLRVGGPGGGPPATLGCIGEDGAAGRGGAKGACHGRIRRTAQDRSVPATPLMPRGRPRCHSRSAFSSHTSQLAAAYTRSEEHTSELQSLMRISYAVFCLKKTTNNT